MKYKMTSENNDKTMTTLALAVVLVINYYGYTKQTHAVAYGTRVSYFIKASTR